MGVSVYYLLDCGIAFVKRKKEPYYVLSVKCGESQRCVKNGNGDGVCECTNGGELPDCSLVSLSFGEKVSVSTPIDKDFLTVHWYVYYLVSKCL
jgi:hypothetical protein